MVPVPVDSTTLAITSAVSAAITFVFCRAMTVTGGISFAIAAVVGIGLYSIGVIPIGLLIVIGIMMVGAIFKSMSKSNKPPE